MDAWIVGGMLALGALWGGRLVAAYLKERDRSREVFKYLTGPYFELNFREMRSFVPVGKHVLEVRRTNDGSWETRLDSDTYDRLKDEILDEWREADEKQKTGGKGIFVAHERFEQLMGFTVQAWRAFLKDPNPKFPDEEPPARRWRKIPDSISPAVEVAYQRYIHHR